MVELRKDLPPGPWDNEPDRKEWNYLGYPCLIVRGPMGALCGYVGLDSNHPWFNIANYDDIPAEVHGGITYAAPCQDVICHTGDGNLLWIGFDCAHAGDIIPQMLADNLKYGLLSGLLTEGTYRDMDYVKDQVEILVKQAAIAL